MPRSQPTEAVFLNVPFDDDYRPLFEAMVFTVLDCGFRPRCALEGSDAGHVRVQKIAGIIRECSLGIHDISRTELDAKTQLPRFNMPFELGLFLGASWLGDDTQRKKNALILDLEQYRYQKFISDIAGQDIKAHRKDPEVLIKAVRNWLRDTQPLHPMPSGGVIAGRYRLFRKQLPVWCRQQKLEEHALQFNDYTFLIWRWLETNHGDREREGGDSSKSRRTPLAIAMVTGKSTGPSGKRHACRIKVHNKSKTLAAENVEASLIEIVPVPEHSHPLSYAPRSPLPNKFPFLLKPESGKGGMINPDSDAWFKLFEQVQHGSVPTIQFFAKDAHFGLYSTDQREHMLGYRGFGSGLRCNQETVQADIRPRFERDSALQCR